jgi:hypothetical protein
MALNGYVIPISAFLSGDFVSLVIKMGGETLIRRRPAAPAQGEAVPGFDKRFVRRIIQDDPRELEVRATRVREARSKASEAAEALKDAVSKTTGSAATWTESGGVRYEHRLWRECIDPFRDYAKSLDGYYPHLTEHSFKGFYVPAPFHRPFPADERLVLRKMVDMGSSTALLEELNQINRGLNVSARWDDLRDGECIPDPDPVKIGYALLESLARQSVHQNAPICFDGE